MLGNMYQSTATIIYIADHNGQSYIINNRELLATRLQSSELHHLPIDNINDII